VPGALRPLPLGTEEADRLLADLSPDERAASWHLIADAPTDALAPSSASSRAGAVPAAPYVAGYASPDVRSATEAGATVPVRWSAGAALAPALALLPGGRFPSALVARMPSLTERGYRWVARHRRLLGRFVPARARRWADRVIATHDVPARPQ
jgi:hypothetical protein